MLKKLLFITLIFLLALPFQAQATDPYRTLQTEELTLQITSAQLRREIGKHQPDNQAFLIIYANLTSRDGDQTCLHDENIKIRVGRIRYNMNPGIAGTFQDEFAKNVDYPGRFSGHCVDDKTELTFVVFDISLTDPQATLIIDEEEIVFPFNLPNALVKAVEHLDSVDPSLPTSTPTIIWTPSITPTPSNTPPPSNTPQPTATATPLSDEDIVAQIFDETLLSADAEDLQTVIVNDRVVTLRFPLSEFLTLQEAQNQFPILVCDLMQAGFTNRTFQITGTIEVIFATGNIATEEGVEMILTNDQAERINCEAAEMFLVDLAQFAERYDVHPLLQE